jgi:hypothetical protein
VRTMEISCEVVRYELHEHILGGIEDMRSHRSISVAVIVFVLAVAAFPVAQDCQALINNLKTSAQGVAITGKNADKERAGLIATLNSASTELGKGKLCDSIKKLNDFKVKVDQLITAGRINTDENAGTTGQDLLTDADAAISCINTQSGGTCGNTQ